MERLRTRRSGPHVGRAATAGALATAALLLALVAAPGVGWAATVQAQNGVVTFTAANGENNRVQGNPGPPDAYDDAFAFDFRDDGAALHAGPGCEDLGVVVRCKGWTPQLRLLDGDDEAHVEHYSVDAIIWGGDGNDDIYGGSGAGSTAIHGGAGMDNLRTSNNGGSAEVTGGSGNDTLWIGEGSFGYYSGGNGDDTIRYAQLGFGVPPSAELETMATAGFEAVIDGGNGTDKLEYYGSYATIDAEQSHFETVILWGGGAIFGSRRGDRLIARGGGETTIFALAGDDVIDVRNDAPGDSVNCGSGRDDVLADPGDSVASNCERQL